MRCLRLFLLFVSFEGEGERSSHADSPTESLTHEVFTSNGDFAMYPILCPDFRKYATVSLALAQQQVVQPIMFVTSSSYRRLHLGRAANTRDGRPILTKEVRM